MKEEKSNRETANTETSILDRIGNLKVSKTYLVLSLVALVLTFAAIALYMWCLKFVSPAADDYTNAVNMRWLINENGGAKLPTVFKMAGVVYQNSQGTWSSMLYLYTVLAFHNLEIWPYRIALLISAGIFFIGAVIFVHELAVGKLKIAYCMPLFFVMMLVAMEHASPSETIYWLTGSAVYTFPAGLGFLSLGLALHDERKRSLPCLIAACILGFFATGGVLILAGFLNIVTVFIILWHLREHKRFPVRTIIYFVCIFAGALINTLAPGNFMRHQSVSPDGSLDIAGALKNTVGLLNWQIGLVARETHYLAVLAVSAILMVIAVGMTKKGKSLTKTAYKVTPISVIIGSYIVCYVTLFPSVLGYNSTTDDMYIEIRLAYMMGWIISMASVFAVAYTTLWILSRVAGSGDEQTAALAGSKVSSKDIGSGRSRVAAALAVVILAAVAVIGVVYANGEIKKTELGETYVSRLFTELQNDKMKQNYEGMQILIYQCKTTPMDHVQYEADIPISKILKHQLLSSDPSWWINMGIANYYEKAWVAYCPPEQT